MCQRGYVIWGYESKHGVYNPGVLLVLSDKCYNEVRVGYNESTLKKEFLE